MSGRIRSIDQLLSIRSSPARTPQSHFPSARLRERPAPRAGRAAWCSRSRTGLRARPYRPVCRTDRFRTRPGSRDSIRWRMAMARLRRGSFANVRFGRHCARQTCRRAEQQLSHGPIGRGGWLFSELPPRSTTTIASGPAGDADDVDVTRCQSVVGWRVAWASSSAIVPAANSSRNRLPQPNISRFLSSSDLPTVALPLAIRKQNCSEVMRAASWQQGNLSPPAVVNVNSNSRAELAAAKRSTRRRSRRASTFAVRCQVPDQSTTSPIPAASSHRLAAATGCGQLHTRKNSASRHHRPAGWPTT